MRYIIVFITGLLINIELSAQDIIYLPYFETINIHRGYQYSATKLFKTYIEKNGKYSVVLPSKYDTNYVCPILQDALNQAREFNARYVILGEMNRLSDLVIVSMNMYSVAEGIKVWSSIEKAANPGDVDPILVKMSELLDNQSRFKDGIYTVTAYNARSLNKKRANGYYGFTINGAAVYAHNVENNFPAGIGFMGVFDNRELIFDLRGDLLLGVIDMYFIAMTVSYPLIEHRNTPYFNGGLGFGGTTIMRDRVQIQPYYSEENYYSYSETEERNNTGLLVIAGGGYLPGRTSSVCLRIGLQAGVPVYKVFNTFPVTGLLSITLMIE